MSPRTRRGVVCVIGVTVLLEVVVGLVPVRAAPVGTTALDLHDDDGGAALFRADDLRPGRVDRSCVGLSVTGDPDPSAQVRLSAEISDGDLAPYLLLTVEQGGVAGVGNCASFTGETLWQGNLADFPATAASGIPTGWRPAGRDRVVHRFTVTVLDDSRAQDLSAAATFVWSLDAAGVEPEPKPEPEPEPEPAPEPLPEPSPQPDPPVASPPAAAQTSTPPSPEPRPDTAVPPAPPAGQPPAGGGDVIEASPLPAGPNSVAEVVEHVAATALSVARDGHFPAALGLLLLAFLALQGAVDRRDPKLALARLHQDVREFRQFPEDVRTEPT